MKILIVIENVCCFGGTEKVAANLANAFAGGGGKCSSF
ncbi:glycosyltransferase family 4 protein [Helicobacter sp. MIT 11-5569]|nr:glycosyltransferase family 4 protein [Helicobacter sp. MIT 11-5569]